MRITKRSWHSWKKRSAAALLCLGTALVGIIVAQTLPGTACPGDPFEAHGLLYSGSAPAGHFLGDGWAQGASMRGVLDADGLPALAANGSLFRAVRTVDPNWGNQGDGFDPTMFAGGNKNSDLIGLGQSPWDWGGGGGSPQKNDITNAYFHTRVDPLTGDRWIFVGAETRSINGDSHVDFEFNQAGIIAMGTTGGLIVGQGPNGGRTIDDFLIIVDFVNGGAHPTASVRYWNGIQFVAIPVDGMVFTATNLTDISHGAGGDWKHFTGDGAETNVLTHLQFVDCAANLTAMGIAVDPCSTDSTFTVKTRSSSSWTADLKDFAIVQFPLEPAPEPAITVPDAACKGGEFEASVVDHTGLPNTSWIWSVNGCGEILGDPTADRIRIAAASVCGCTMELRVDVVGGDCLTHGFATAQVRIGDDFSPELGSRPADRTVECNAILDRPSVTANDDCADVAVLYAEETQPGTCNGDATIVRTWSAVDGCDNEVLHSQTITVQDTQAPALHGVPTDTQVSCESIPPPTEVTASDNCSATEVELVESQIPGQCYGELTLRRTWSAFDECGNESSQTQTIDVVDQIAPQLVGVPANGRAECDAIPAPAQVTATDNCSDAPVQLVQAVTNQVCQGNWTLTRTWTATDSCGNPTSANQTITVEDTSAPILFGVPADTTVECSAIPNPAIVTATDNCSESPVTFTERTEPGAGVGSATIFRTWTATDACGNEILQVQVLTVIDTIRPQLFGMPADTTVSCDAIPPAAVVTATDNCATPTVRLNETTQPGDCDGRWIIIRRWTATDDSGNEISQTQIIHVADDTPPAFGTVPDDQTVECDAVPAPDQLTAADNCSAVTIDLHESAEPGDCEGRETITRTWTAMDDCGNATSHVQVLQVEDTAAPVLNGHPQDVTVECHRIPSATTLTATDQCDSHVPVLRTEQKQAGTCVGESVIHRVWTAEDDCGNTVQHDQTVTVHDTTAPTISLSSGSPQFICDGRPVAFTIRSNDNCSSPQLSMTNLTAITSNSRDRVMVVPQPDGTIKITATGPAMLIGSALASDDCENMSAPFRFTLSARLGREACSQGFWRNHVERWGPTGFSPSQGFLDAFQITDLSSPEIPASFDETMTLLEAGNMTGGSFNQTMLQGVAALLNAAYPNMDYPWTTSQVQAVMRSAFAGTITFAQATAFFNTGNGVEGECGCPVQ